MDIDRYLALRPFVYHLTAPFNLTSIREAGELRSAAELANRSGDASILRERRREAIAVASAMIRDQAPLHAGNIQLDPGFSFAQLLDLLNAHVYFWSGDAAGPIAYGRRHFARYSSEMPL